MKKTIIVVLFVLGMTFTSDYVKAECMTSEKVRLKKIVANIAINYDYAISNDEIEFKVVFSNLHKDIYIQDTLSDKRYDYSQNTENPNELTINGYKSGTSIKYIFYATLNACKDEQISIQYVNLPYFNKYYSDPLCSGIEDYSLCQKWTTLNFQSHDEFKKEILKYKQTLVDNNDVIDNNNNNESHFSLLDNIIQVIFKYYYVGLILIIIICLYVIYKLNKKNSFNF